VAEQLYPAHRSYGARASLLMSFNTRRIFFTPCSSGYWNCHIKSCSVKIQYLHIFGLADRTRLKLYCT